MAHQHDHHHGQVTAENSKKLTFALILTLSFLIVEVIAGFVTQSLALLSDAAHMFTDAAALAIALIAIKLGKLPADNKRTFGYQRFEILAALFNAGMLFVVAIYIVYEAYQRLSQPAEIQSLGMLVVASLGLLVNLISMKILFSGSQQNLNMKGAYLEVLSDALGSVGVILGAILIYFTAWMWVDTVIAVLIGFWVLPRTWVLVKQSVHILLEGVPEEIEIEQLRQDLLNLNGVQGIHQLKVWAISSQNIHLTAHLFAPDANSDVVYRHALELLTHEYGISEVTLQIEHTECTAHHMHEKAHDHPHDHTPE